MPRQRGPDAADVPGKFAADGMVFELPSQYRDGAAAARQGLRHELETGAESGRNRQGTARRTKYSEHDRADKMLDVPSLMDGMSDHEHKRNGDNHPPTAEERELREYPLDLAAVRKKLADKQGKQYSRTLGETLHDPQLTG